MNTDASKSASEKEERKSHARKKKKAESKAVRRTQVSTLPMLWHLTNRATIEKELFPAHTHNQSTPSSDPRTYEKPRYWTSTASAAGPPRQIPTEVTRARRDEPGAQQGRQQAELASAAAPSGCPNYRTSAHQPQPQNRSGPSSAVHATRASPSRPHPVVYPSKGHPSKPALPGTPTAQHPPPSLPPPLRGESYKHAPLTLPPTHARGVFSNPSATPRAGTTAPQPPTPSVAAARVEALTAKLPLPSVPRPSSEHQKNRAGEALHQTRASDKSCNKQQKTYHLACVGAKVKHNRRDGAVDLEHGGVAAGAGVARSAGRAQPRRRAALWRRRAAKQSRA